MTYDPWKDDREDGARGMDEVNQARQEAVEARQEAQAARQEAQEALAKLAMVEALLSRVMDARPMLAKLMTDLYLPEYVASDYDLVLIDPDSVEITQDEKECTWTLRLTNPPEQTDDDDHVPEGWQ